MPTEQEHYKEPRNTRRFPPLRKGHGKYMSDIYGPVQLDLYDSFDKAWIFFKSNYSISLPFSKFWIQSPPQTFPEYSQIPGSRSTALQSQYIQTIAANTLVKCLKEHIRNMGSNRDLLLRLTLLVIV